MAFFSFPERVNERAARLVAGAVLLLLGCSLAFHLPWLLPLLAVGFLLRVGWGPRFSPLARLALLTAGRLWEPRPVSGPPKRFAQAIGAICTVSASLLLAVGLPEGARALVLLVMVCAALEAVLGFCLGCVLYGKLQRLGLVARDACVECADAACPAEDPPRPAAPAR